MLKKFLKNLLVLLTIFSLLSVYLPIFSTISYAQNIDTEIINIVKNIPKYYVFDMDIFHDRELDITQYISQQLERYIVQLINDASIEIKVENSECERDFTFIKFSADISIFKDGVACDTIHFGFEDSNQITMFALITLPKNMEKTETAYITYAKNIIENNYNCTYPYKIEKYEQLKDKDIVLLDTKKFGTIKYKGEGIEFNLYSFTSQDDKAISGPLLLMQETDDNDDDTGMGTEESPYLISTPEQLNAIRDNLSASYKLLNDIDLTYDTSNENGKFYNDGKGWEAIETFTGKLDGNNKKIIGINQNFEKTDSNIYESGKCGLFASIKGTVENLKIENINILYSNLLENKQDATVNYIGGLTGSLSGTINNVYTEGVIQVNNNNTNFSSTYISGIVGYMENGVISNSINSVDINSNGCNIAGIVGCLDNGRLVNNVNNGNIVGNNCTASGIVANAFVTDSIAEIVKCKNYGKISSYSAAGIISAAAGINIIECSNYGDIIIQNVNSNGNSYQGQSGGIVGFLYSSSFDTDEQGNSKSLYSKVEKCLNVGDIIVEIRNSGRNGVDIGGLVGSTTQNNNIYNSYNAGRIDIKNSYNIIVGGLIGRHQSCVSNCYNIGEFSIVGNYSDYRVCELIGAIVRMDTDETVGKVQNCYCADRGINILSNDGDSKELDYYVLSLEDLRLQSSYKNFDFENVWNMNENTTYNFPQLNDNYIEVIIQPKFKLSGILKTYGIDEREKTKVIVSNQENLDILFEKNIEGIENQTYDFSLETGIYIITVSKKNHVTRRYEIEIKDKDLECNLEISLLGDTNGDGKSNNKDWDRMYRHINGTSVLTDYQLLCADINNDGKVNNKDWNRLYNHINGTDLLY